MNYIGIDIGGTNLKAGLVNDEGSILPMCWPMKRATGAPGLWKSAKLPRYPTRKHWWRHWWR